MSKAHKVTLELNKDKFPDLLDKLGELQKIGDGEQGGVVKLKINKDETIMYALKGDSAILAFKSYTFPTSDYFIFKDDFDFTFDFIIGSTQKFIKTSKIFNLGLDEKLKMTLSYRENNNDETMMQVRAAQIKDSKFKFSVIIAEPYKIRDINKKLLMQKLDLDNAAWHFDCSKSDLDDIKKMAAIYDDSILNINVNEGDVEISQAGQWNLNVAKIEEKGDSLSIDKKYLKLITIKEDIIKFSIFDRFILFKEDNMNLMIAYELTFE